ncbi:protein yae1-like [Phoenix dactylifera]|uniref:Protein yae1-like n=1 Tax=Phoenix dactylifera TaxID=42345 RepID=A0A8B8ZM08_PHODC|nr:protein yae1-like [Phoenix dactylifera]
MKPNQLNAQPMLNPIYDDGSDNFWFEDDLSNDILDDGSSHASILNREGRCRHNKNHTMGYRDSITAGKEASAQKGFSVGFRKSAYVGYRWGLVRGITWFLNLDESVQAISANDALKISSNKLENIYKDLISLLNDAPEIKLRYELVEGPSRNVLVLYE